TVSHPLFISIFVLRQTKIEIKDKLNLGIPIVLQIAKLIPQGIINSCVADTKADAYYKTLTTNKHLVCMLYGVLTKCNSLNLLSKNLQFLHNRLTSIGIEEIPARSTLADANAKRTPEVFERIYNELYHHYCHLLGNESYSLISDMNGEKKVEIIDSSTIGLFHEIFRG